MNLLKEQILQLQSDKFIFPEKHFKEIITVNAYSDNLMYIVYSNLNEDIQLLINYYGRTNHTNASFSKDMNLIKQTVNNTRRIYATATVVVAGDFNIKTKPISTWKAKFNM